jgi:hypothetical protein
MPGNDPNDAGPFKFIQAFGVQVPYYVIRFDKDGACLSPQAVAHLISATGNYSPVLVYSHGWNNDFPTSTALYDRFLAGLSAMAAANPPLPYSFKPLFIGISWPSTALTFGAENGPDIAAAVAGEEVAALLQALPEGARAEAAAMLGQEGIAIEDARRLAGWVAETLGGEADTDVGGAALASDDILSGWALGAADGPEQGGFDDFGVGGGQVGDIQAAAWPEFLDPRWVVRLATVLIMKDRAGVVGANGVADLIGRLLDETDARVFLFGHSYGCKVVMTALSVLSAGPPARKVSGVLLLQPAVSRLCFAEDAGGGTQGGYVRALPLADKPILATYSDQDFPLTKIFHIVARRALDAGELQFAGEPSRYAALGGYGASGWKPGTGADIPLPAVGNWPAIAPGVRLISLNGSGQISGHGDVSRAETYWAAFNLLK